MDWRLFIINKTPFINSMECIRRPGDHLLTTRLGDYDDIIYMALDKTVKQAVDSPHIRKVIDCIRIEQDRLNREFEEYKKSARSFIDECITSNNNEEIDISVGVETKKDTGSLDLNVKVVSLPDIFKNFNRGYYHLAGGRGE